MSIYRCTLVCRSPLKLTLILTAWYLCGLCFYAMDKKPHLCNDVQIRICNDASHLNNLVLLYIQPGHLKQEVQWH